MPRKKNEFIIRFFDKAEIYVTKSSKVKKKIEI